MSEQDHILSQEEIDALLRSQESVSAVDAPNDGDVEVLAQAWEVVVHSGVAAGGTRSAGAVAAGPIAYRVGPWNELRAGLSSSGGVGWGVAVEWQGEPDGFAVSFAAAAELDSLNIVAGMMGGGAEVSHFLATWVNRLATEFADLLGGSLQVATGEPVQVDFSAPDSPLPFSDGEQIVEFSHSLMASGEAGSLVYLIPLDVANQWTRRLVQQAEAHQAAGRAAPSTPTPQSPATRPVQQAASSVQAHRSEPTAASGMAARSRQNHVGGRQTAPAVDVRPAQFESLGVRRESADVHNIGLILDVPLRVTVELGRTRMQIREILELGKGSVIELEKLAGEPVDVLVNGKLLAKGEVVVIDENFGVKITDIVSPLERLGELQ